MGYPSRSMCISSDSEKLSSALKDDVATKAESNNHGDCWMGRNKKSGTCDIMSVLRLVLQHDSEVRISRSDRFPGILGDAVLETDRHALRRMSRLTSATGTEQDSRHRTRVTSSGPHATSALYLPIRTVPLFKIIIYIRILEKIRLDSTSTTNPTMKYAKSPVLTFVYPFL